LLVRDFFAFANASSVLHGGAILAVRFVLGLLRLVGLPAFRILNDTPLLKQFIKAVVLRLVFEFPLNPSEPESVITVFFILAGVTTAFFIIPWFGLKRLMPRSIMSMGRQHVGSGSKVEQLTDRAPSGRELTERVREVSTPSSGARLSGRDGAGSTGNLRARVGSVLGSRHAGGEAQDTRSRTGDWPESYRSHGRRIREEQEQQRGANPFDDR